MPISDEQNEWLKKNHTKEFKNFKNIKSNLEKLQKELTKLIKKDPTKSFLGVDKFNSTTYPGRKKIVDLINKYDNRLEMADSINYKLVRAILQDILAESLKVLKLEHNFFVLQLSEDIGNKYLQQLRDITDKSYKKLSALHTTKGGRKIPRKRKKKIKR